MCPSCAASCRAVHPSPWYLLCPLEASARGEAWHGRAAVRVRQRARSQARGAVLRRGRRRGADARSRMRISPANGASHDLRFGSTPWPRTSSKTPSASPALCGSARVCVCTRPQQGQQGPGECYRTERQEAGGAPTPCGVDHSRCAALACLRQPATSALCDARGRRRVTRTRHGERARSEERVEEF